jgi:hypothetical protein
VTRLSLDIGFINAFLGSEFEGVLMSVY